MNTSQTLCRLALAAAASLCLTVDICAESAIYACGHIRRNRNEAIGKLRKSGYNTAIIFNVNVEADGTLTTDFDWNNQRPSEAGGIICSDGKYTFGSYQPNFAGDIRTLLTQPTSINRIEICIGGWGNGSYGNIRDLINSRGTGPETALYRNFKALKEAIPEIVAVNNDQEQDYDLESATLFHRMLADIGFKTTIAPYMNRDYWRDLVAALNSTPGTCEIVYLQTYGGGAANNPADWDVFGDIPMHVGFDCEASDDIARMQQQFTDWRDNCNVAGGFLWNYNSEARDLNEWATAINRIFPSARAEQVAATIYQDADYGGYAVDMPEGSFPQALMAVYGIRAKDITSMKITPGYKVTLFEGIRVNGPKSEWTESTPYLGDSWNDKACSMVIERTADSGACDAIADSPDADPTRIYSLGGQLLETGGGNLQNITLPAGLYIAVNSSGARKIVIKQ